MPFAVSSPCNFFYTQEVKLSGSNLDLFFGFRPTSLSISILRILLRAFQGKSRGRLTGERRTFHKSNEMATNNRANKPNKMEYVFKYA